MGQANRPRGSGKRYLIPVACAGLLAACGHYAATRHLPTPERYWGCYVASHEEWSELPIPVVRYLPVPDTFELSAGRAQEESLIVSGVGRQVGDSVVYAPVEWTPDPSGPYRLLPDPNPGVGVDGATWTTVAPDSIELHWALLLYDGEVLRPLAVRMRLGVSGHGLSGFAYREVRVAGHTEALLTPTDSLEVVVTPGDCPKDWPPPLRGWVSG